MDAVIAVAGWTLFGVAIAIGLLLDLVGLFGNWIILLAITAAMLLTGFEHFTWWTVGILLVLAILGEVLETIAAGMGAARFGGGKGAITAAVVGCIAGAILGSPILPIIGTILGACLGAFAAAALYEYLMMDRTVGQAMNVGFGAAAGKVAGIFLKFFVGLIMLGIAALQF
ncbi:MAG: DUF456 domain-containing protein [Candidatus Hydrogenedentales bacterium]